VPLRYIKKLRIHGKWGNCDYCKKEVWIYPRNQKRKNKFCNREHQILFRKQKAFHKNCEICNKIFYCQPIQIKLRNRKHCSVTCFHKARALQAKENRIKNGFTKHQIDRCIRYSAEADRWRKAVFERDDYICQFCKQRGGYLEADHIKSFAHYPELHFELSNGRTLCRNCHMKTDTWGRPKKLCSEKSN